MDPVQEEAIQTSSNASDSESSTPFLSMEGVLIGNEYKIGSVLGEANHATIYSARRVSTAVPAGSASYEARVFNFINLSPSYERYRRRAMSRLSARSVHRAKIGDSIIVIYETDHSLPAAKARPKSFDQGQGGARVVQSESPQDSTLASVNQTNKTEARRESQRLRQRDRRRAKREQERHPKITISGLQFDTHESILPNEGRFQMREVDFYMFVTLHLVEDGRWRHTPADTIPERARSAIQQWVNVKTSDAYLREGWDEDYLQELVKVKQREIVSLKRQNNKYKPLEVKWRLALADILRQQQQIPARTPKWVKMQDALVGPSRAKFRILQAGLRALPVIIENTERVTRDLQQTLATLRQDRIEKEKQDAAKRNQESAQMRVKNYRTLMPLVVPGSEVYAELERDLKKAESDLAKLNIS